MNRSLRALPTLLFLLTAGVAAVHAQSLDRLHLQAHGYATQSLIYTTRNNWNTTSSSDGSLGWTEGVLNVTSQPSSRWRLGAQARYFRLGQFGNRVTCDWAAADFKPSERFGIRAGKVKTPTAMFNEIQDIDPAHLWILLPQSVYPLASRNSTLTHYGAVAYGTIELGERRGKLEYRGFAGQRAVGSDDGFFQPFRDHGITVPGGIHGRTLGASLRWQTPLQGLMLGATEDSEHPSGALAAGPYPGAFTTPVFFVPYFFGHYDRGKVMFAAEYNRTAVLSTIQFPGLPTTLTPADRRAFYVMASYKLASRLTSGLYYSSVIDRQAAFTSARFQKDWALSTRYDFNPFLYIKAEQHFMDGALVGYSTSNNPGGLQSGTRMTLLTLGVTF